MGVNMYKYRRYCLHQVDSIILKRRVESKVNKAENCLFKEFFDIEQM